jgi:hypothetical protein
MTVNRGWVLAIAWCGVLVLGLAACGGVPPSPLQSPMQSPILTATATLQLVPTQPPPVQPPPPGATITIAPTVTPVPTVPPPTPTPPLAVPTLAVPAVPTAARTPLFQPTPFGTPDIAATSRSVFATITAQALPPAFPATPTPGQPIGAGPRALVTAIPTPTLDPSGISLLSLSARVYAGGAAVLTIRTQPGATCALSLVRAATDGNPYSRPAPGGGSRIAGDDGIIAWIWPVEASEAPGKITLELNCGSAGSARYEIEVTT